MINSRRLSKHRIREQSRRVIVERLGPARRQTPREGVQGWEVKTLGHFLRQKVVAKKMYFRDILSHDRFRSASAKLL